LRTSLQKLLQTAISRGQIRQSFQYFLGWLLFPPNCTKTSAAFSPKFEARLFAPNKIELFNSAVSLFSATLVAATILKSLKAELLDPDRQRLMALLPEAVEYPEHFYTQDEFLDAVASALLKGVRNRSNGGCVLHVGRNPQTRFIFHQVGEGGRRALRSRGMYGINSSPAIRACSMVKAGLAGSLSGGASIRRPEIAR
jgi:hypothetical protein